MITPEQSREGRILLGWTPFRLALLAGISLQRVSSFEAAAEASFKTVAAIQEALEGAGVEFIPGNGGGAAARRLAVPDERSRTAASKRGVPCSSHSICRADGYRGLGPGLR
jgi:hypothetical protein